MIVVLESPRLNLVPYSPMQLLALIEKPETFEVLTGYPAAEGLRGFFVSGDVSQQFLDFLRSGTGPDIWTFGFALVHREKKCVIGSGAFKGAPDENGTVEIAYGIVPEFEAQGYATEVARTLVEFAFQQQEVRVVRAHTLPVKNASTTVLTRCGFTHLGEVEDPDDGLVWRWEIRRLED